MTIKIGSNVEITGGFYKGTVGKIEAVRNSARDGRSYIIRSSSTPITIQIKEKFVSEPVSVADKSRLYNFEGKWVFCTTGVKIYEHSIPQNSYEERMTLTSMPTTKQVLVTLVYEDYDTIVANVVFQGQYAVVDAEKLRLSDSRAAGLA